MSFATKSIPLLKQLAINFAQSDQFSRLNTVSHYLSLLSSGQWNRLGDEERLLFMEKIKSDFHPRAWDDMNYQSGPYRDFIDIAASTLDHYKSITNNL